MSAARLRAVTDMVSVDWGTAIGRLVAHWAPTIATIDDPARAEAVLASLIRREGARARRLGVTHSKMIAHAGGITPVDPEVFEVSGGTVARRLRNITVREWARAAASPLPDVDVRAAAMARTIDARLSEQWRAGLGDQMVEQPEVIGWRRRAEPGACGACLALADGSIHTPGASMATHPRCRCVTEMVIRGVNDTEWGRPTGQEMFDGMSPTEQDALFLGHGGAEKARLLRSGEVAMSDLVSEGSARLGGRRIITETPLKDLAA